MKTKIVLCIPRIQIMMTGVQGVERVGNKFTLIYSDDSRESATLKGIAPWVEGEELPEDFNLFTLIGKVQATRKGATV